MPENSSDRQNLQNGYHKAEIVPIKNKPPQPKPFGDQRKAVLRQEFMVLLMNIGLLVGGMTLALPAVTLDQLTNPSELVYLNKSQASWFASASSITCPLGSFLSALTTQKLGSKITIVVTNFIAIVAWALMAFMFSTDPNSIFVQLIVSRLISGVATGMGVGPAGVYGAEISLPRIRAKLIMAVSMAVASGVLFVYLLGYFLRNNWKLLGMILLVYQIACLILLTPVKESPNWLLSKGRIEEARASLSFFRGLDAGQTHDEVDAEFDLLKKAIQLKSGERKISFFKALCQPKVYKPLLLMIVLFACQQFSGLFVVIVYAVQITTKAGAKIDPFLCSVLLGVARFFIATFLMSWVVTKWNRRHVGIFSASSMAFCMFLLAASSYFPWLQISFLPVAVLVVFIVTGAGMWALPFVINSELFPQSVRGALCGATVGFTYLMSFSAIKIYPSMEDSMGSGNVFAFYGVVAIITALFIFKFIPETKGKTLLEIEEHFEGNKKGSLEIEREVEMKEVLVKANGANS